TRPANIAEQKLQDCGGTDDLHPVRMLRPADCVADGSGFIRAGSRTVSLRNFQKEIFGNAAILLHHLRRIAREMLFEYLIHTAGMPQSRVRFMLTQLA